MEVKGPLEANLANDTENMLTMSLRTAKMRGKRRCEEVKCFCQIQIQTWVLVRKEPLDDGRLLLGWDKI